MKKQQKINEMYKRLRQEIFMELLQLGIFEHGLLTNKQLEAIKNYKSNNINQCEKGFLHYCMEASPLKMSTSVARTGHLFKKGDQYGL